MFQVIQYRQGRKLFAATTGDGGDCWTADAAKADEFDSRGAALTVAEFRADHGYYLRGYVLAVVRSEKVGG